MRVRGLTTELLKGPMFQHTGLEWHWVLILGCMLEKVTCPFLKEMSLHLSSFSQDRKLFITSKMGETFFGLSIFCVLGSWYYQQFLWKLTSKPRPLRTQILWYLPTDPCVPLCLSYTKGEGKSPPIRTQIHCMSSSVWSLEWLCLILKNLDLKVSPIKSVS